MKETTDKIRIKYLKSKTGLNDIQIEMLTYQNPYLVDCSLKNEEDYFELEFNTDNMKGFAAIKEMGEYEKCVVLLNVASLNNISEDYEFDLFEDNLMIDFSLNPKVLQRGFADNRTDFLSQYKSLCAFAFSTGYSQQDFLIGGKDLYNKKSTIREVDLQEIWQKQTVEELYEYLVSVAEAIEKKNKDSFLLVDKKKYRRNRRIIPVLLLTTLLAMVAVGYLYLVKYKNDETIITASNQYIANEYAAVTETLNDMEISDLPYETKYLLARSYLSMESFTGKNSGTQRKRVMSGITLKTDERYFDYWIQVGRLNFEAAVDYAKQLNDDEMLYYALVKEKDAVDKDSSMSGKKKESKLKEINEQLKSLEEAMKEDK